MSEQNVQAITNDQQRKALQEAGWELWDFTVTRLPEANNEVWRSPSRDCYVTLYDERYYNASPHTVHAYSRIPDDDSITPANLMEAVQVAAILGLLHSSSEGVMVPKEMAERFLGYAKGATLNYLRQLDDPRFHPTVREEKDKLRLQARDDATWLFHALSTTPEKERIPTNTEEET